MTDRRVVPDGKAQSGDWIRVDGRLVQVESVTSAHDVIEAQVEQSIRDYKATPHFTRDSIAGRCLLFGETSGREKRDHERLKARRAKEKLTHV